MKKILLVALSVLLFASAASAQSKALGVRLGGDAEVSFQQWSGNNFIEADLGLALGSYGGLRFSAAYDFVLASPGSWNIYLGPGAQVGLYNYSSKEGAAPSNHLGVGLGGQLGAEYQFGGIPLNLSIDWRPMWNFLGSRGVWSSAAIGIRYRF